MEIRVLKYFLTVAREGASRERPRSSTSRSLRFPARSWSLKKETGVKLLDRGSRHVSLTSDGLLLKRRAEEIVDLVDKTEKNSPATRPSRAR